MNIAHSRSVSLTAVCLGLCSGVCAPLFVSGRADRVLQLTVLTVPLCLLSVLALHWLVQKMVQRRGTDPCQAATHADNVLVPLWILSFSPVCLVLPAPAIPLIFGFVALGLVAYRLGDLIAGSLRHQPRQLELYTFFILFIAFWVLLFQTTIVHDAFQYYGYMASILLDGDLGLYDQVYLSNTDRSYNPFPLRSARYIGTALMQSPFFAAGHGAAWLLNLQELTYAPNGYTLPYRLFVSLASGLFGLGGLVACYFLTREFFPRRISLMAVVAVWLASALVFFMYCWNGWAHPFAFFFSATFLLVWQRTRTQRNVIDWALLGMLMGLLCLIRPANAVVLVFPLGEWLTRLRSAKENLSSHWRDLLIGPSTATLTALLMFSPQLTLWKGSTGGWLAAPYKEVGDYHNWLHPDFLGVLFSTTQHGLFTWTPLLLVATAGLVLLWHHDRLLAACSALAVAGTIYLYASWSIWWSGIGFSNRFFLELTPFFVLGLAALIHWAQRHVSRETVCGVLLCAVVWNLMLVADYRSNLIPQGIPDPWRVVDDPLDLGRLVTGNLRLDPNTADGPYWLAWARDGFVTERLINVLTFRNVSGMGGMLCGLALAGLLSWALLRVVFARNVHWEGQKVKATVIASGVALSLALHVVLSLAATRTVKAGNFFHFKESFLTAQQPGEDVDLYPDYPLPVTTVDLLSFLVYGHGVPQGTAVAELAVFDDAGNEFRKLLRAGEDTAETSYLRPEYRHVIQHGIEGTQIVRDRPSHAYSDHMYDLLTFQSSFELPQPMVVRRARLRYLHTVGRLVVEDLFLRDF